MLFSTVFVSAIAALVSTVSAASPNPFHEPISTSVLTAGKTFNITWGPTTSGTITLLLKKGLSTDLTTVSTIASDIANSGSYLWSIPATLATGTDYAFEITNAADEVNYTPQFTIDGVAASYSSAAASSTSSTTIISTHHIVSTSTVATVTAYSSRVTSAPYTIHPNATIPVTSAHSNGTIAISTLVPTGGETTVGPATTTKLPVPTASSPSAAGAIKVAMGVLGGAFVAVCAMLL